MSESSLNENKDSSKRFENEGVHVADKAPVVVSLVAHKRVVSVVLIVHAIFLQTSLGLKVVRILALVCATLILALHQLKFRNHR